MRFFTGFAGIMALVYASAVAAASPVPAAKPDLERGKQLATTVCAACHGPDGNSPAAANPSIAGQHGGYVALQLAAFKSGARPSPVMQSMAAGLSAEDMLSVGAYFETQKPAPRFARDKAAAEREGWPLLPFPAHGKLTAPLRQASARAGSADLFSAWSGQAGSLARPLPAAELGRVLVDEAREVIGHLRRITEAPRVP